MRGRRGGQCRACRAHSHICEPRPRVMAGAPSRDNAGRCILSVHSHHSLGTRTRGDALGSRKTSRHAPY